MTIVIVKTQYRLRSDGGFHDGSQRHSDPRALPPRERMVRSAAQLIRRKGVSGTGMREIVTEADAPRGSLQHYFPGGKEELVSDALLWAGDLSARRVKRSLSELKSRTPSALLASIVEPGDAISPTSSFRPGAPWWRPPPTRQLPASSSAKCSDAPSTVGSNRYPKAWPSLAYPPSGPTISPS